MVKLVDSIRGEYRQCRHLLAGFIFFFFIITETAYSQTVFGNKGLITIPTAQMNENGTFMGGGNFLPKGIIGVTDWNYNSWNYYINATFLSFWDVGFRFTGLKLRSGQFNQDRSVYTKIRPIKEQKWIPAIAIGCEDLKIAKFNSNNYHMKLYITATKTLKWSNNSLNFSLGYMYRRNEENLHYIMGGICYTPLFAKNLRVMLEYDGRHPNMGLQYLLFRHLALTAATYRFNSFTGGASILFKIR